MLRQSLRSIFLEHMDPVSIAVDDLRELYLREMALVRQTWERTGDGTAAIPPVRTQQVDMDGIGTAARQSQDGQGQEECRGAPHYEPCRASAQHMIMVSMQVIPPLTKLCKRALASV